MKNKKYTWDEIESIFTKALDEAHAVNTYTRSERLQKEQIERIGKTINLIKSFKYQAINKNDEHMANEFFRQQCMLSSLRSSLQCWILVKSNDFEKAWTALIDAQEYCAIAIKIEKFEGLENLHNHLKAIEKSIFPEWALYNSTGILETIGKCSICDSPFNNCNHIEDEIYMGRLCRRIDRNIIEVNHSALVAVPYDKRCIITHITQNGEIVDNFTREATGEINENKEENIFRGRLMCMEPLDLD